MKDTEYNFYALTPIDNVDIGVYENALDFVFAHDNVRNVAVSGSYGSGKSSVLASYKRKHGDKKFLHISLTHFHAAKGNDDPSHPDGEISPKTILEGKILNQLIHQISIDKIPLTNFRVKKELATWRNTITALLTVAGVILGLYEFYFAQVAAFLQSLTVDWLKNLLAFLGHPESRLIAGVGFFVIAGIFIYHFKRLLKTRHIIKKAEVSGLEIEIFEDSKESYFDKYLNEVLYLFEKVGADVIVFEDIDRYDSSRIFERLHEINRLVNNDRKATPLRFFYLMRDDIFESKDRTKFFDFIIPIVPVIDCSNSFNKFIECFEKSGLIGNEKSIIDIEFLQGLSIYIDDMRVLKNICNEFLVYHGRLSTTEQDSNKMLAIIAFKNLFPRDFDDLQLGRGFMFEIIGGNGKERLISSEQEKLQEIIKIKTTELSSIKNETLFSDEIAMLYCLKLWVSSGHRIPLSDNADSCRQLIEQYRSQQHYKDITTEYDNRKKYSEENILKSNTRISSIETEISRANRSLSELKGLRLKELITRENIVDLFQAKYTSETGHTEDFKQLKDSPYFALLKYLVREGFIDETYSDYMTYFYENSLTRTDKVFLRSVTDKKAKEVTYQLDNPPMVVSRLPLAYFGQVETLNFVLFDFLMTDFSGMQSFIDKTKRLMRQLAENERFDFILSYSEQKDQLVNMVKAFGYAWSSFLADCFTILQIGKEPSTPKTKNDVFISKYAYSLLALIGEDSARMTFLDNASKESLVGYLSNDANILSVDDGYDDKNLALGIQLLDLCFNTINAETARRSLLERVYRDNSYIINYGNIETMLKVFYSTPDISTLRTANYSVVMAEAASPLASYINANINTYIDVFLAECGETITDTPKNAILLLNNDIIEKSQKKLYIAYLKSTIAELFDIADKDLWGELLNNHTTVEYTAKNIVTYFFEKCQNAFDNTLLNYINKNGASITLDNCFEDKDKQNTFFTATVKAASLDNEIYKGFIVQFKLHYQDFSIADLPNEKVTILDECGKIKMSAQSLIFMREHYADYLYTFIVRHIAEYIPIVADKSIFVLDEARKLLNAQINDADKIALLSLDTTPISISGKKYSDAVAVHILLHNYDANDFNYLLESYSNFEKQTQAAILERVTTDINNVLHILNIVDNQLLNALFVSDKVDETNKKNMFKIISPSASDSDIKYWLPCIGCEDFLVLYEERKRPKFENNEWNKSLLDVFKERKLIDDYELDEKNQKFSIIRQRKVQSKAGFID